MTKRITPRHAMSARQVDRVERELTLIIRVMRRRWPLLRTRTLARLTRLLAAVRRSERR